MFHWLSKAECLKNPLGISQVLKSELLGLNGTHPTRTESNLAWLCLLVHSLSYRWSKSALHTEKTWVHIYNSAPYHGLYNLHTWESCQELNRKMAATVKCIYNQCFHLKSFLASEMLRWHFLT
jgi:hypothetical protein